MSIKDKLSVLVVDDMSTSRGLIPRTAKIGFVLISGRLDDQIVSTGRQLGLNNVLQKPFDTAQMKVCLQAVVGPL